MKLGDLIEGLDVREVGGGDVRALRICDINEDSRTVVPGSLFIARAGTKADGKAFVADAVRAGAVAVLTDDVSLRAPGAVVLSSGDVALATAQMAERFYGSCGSRLSLVAITGTNGKTTGTYLVWQLLNAAHTARAPMRCGLIGTVVVDDGTEVAPANMTTPPAIEVSRSLQRMWEAGCVAAALEVSSHALDQKRTDALRFAVGVFTNLTGDHLDYHGTMERYAGAKARLFEGLSESATAVVHAQDPWCQRMVRDCSARVVRCGVIAAGGTLPAGLDAGVRVHGMALEGMDLELVGPWGEVRARVGLIGAYNAMNVLQAVCCAHVLGVSREQLAQALPGLSAPPGRLERVSGKGDAVHVFVDYAHSDDSLRNVLEAVAGVMRAHAGQIVEGAAGGTRGGRVPGLWVVFGCGGDRDKTKRPRMGRAAASIADKVIVTSDNPRTERPSEIVDEILAGVEASQRGKVSVQVDRARAIELAIAQAAAGDVVIIAGKGHETEQILPDGKGGTVRMHFDDREVARAELAKRR
jgi:UDP-N-acetylmuramoyl-L-alanyl-D-glutamate--2,6-diaminopimelate ligase